MNYEVKNNSKYIRVEIPVMSRVILDKNITILIRDTKYTK